MFHICSHTPPRVKLPRGDRVLIPPALFEAASAHNLSSVIIREYAFMGLILLIIVLVLLFGGGGGYYAHRSYGGRGSGGVLGLIVIVLLVVWLFGGFGGGYYH